MSGDDIGNTVEENYSFFVIQKSYLPSARHMGSKILLQ